MAQRSSPRRAFSSRACQSSAGRPRNACQFSSGTSDPGGCCSRTSGTVATFPDDSPDDSFEASALVILAFLGTSRFLAGEPPRIGRHLSLLIRSRGTLAFIPIERRFSAVPVACNQAVQTTLRAPRDLGYFVHGRMKNINDLFGVLVANSACRRRVSLDHICHPLLAQQLTLVALFAQLILG